MVCVFKHLYCSAQLSMSSMEKRYRNKIIIIIINVELLPSSATFPCDGDISNYSRSRCRCRTSPVLVGENKPGLLSLVENKTVPVTVRGKNRSCYSWWKPVLLHLQTKCTVTGRSHIRIQTHMWTLTQEGKKEQKHIEPQMHTQK